MEQLNLLQQINAIIIVIGLPAIVGTAIYVGRKLQVLDDLVRTCHKIKVNLKITTDYLTKHHDRFDGSELENYSPLQLTDKGNDLINDLKFNEIFDKNKDEFFEYIDSEEVKLKYDVENSAIKSIYFLYDKEFMNPIKVFFYNNPSRTIQNTAPTLGIYIRDIYLSEHPDIIE